MLPKLAGEVTAPEPQTEERGAGLALMPIAATLIFYALPSPYQELTIAQFVPQIIAYLALGIWISLNQKIVPRIGLQRCNFRLGLRWGVGTGFLLGVINTLFILGVAPRLGYDIFFLTTTPHAQLPVLLMIPWFIGAIAFFVEVNFRGFILGRLLAWGHQRIGTKLSLLPQLIIVGISAITFAFDPFMVKTFQHLHWIALWDGMIWGIIWLRTKNLHATIIAHAFEVLMIYCILRLYLMP